MVRACQILCILCPVRKYENQDIAFCKDIFLPVPPGGQLFIENLRLIRVDILSFRVFKVGQNMVQMYIAHCSSICMGQQLIGNIRLSIRPKFLFVI